jgi:hypothetical protein
MFLEALNINFGNIIECYVKPSRLLSSGNYNSAFKRQGKLNHDRAKSALHMNNNLEKKKSTAITFSPGN